MADHTCGDEEESGALQLSLPEYVRNSLASALTLRNNVSIWYELLDPSKLMPLLRDKFEFTDAQVKEVESYHDHPRAQAVAILLHFFKPNVHIPSICTSIQSLEGIERLSSRMIKDYQYYKAGTQPRDLPIRSHCQIEDSKLSEPFLKLLRDVIGHLSDYPNALEALKTVLNSLVYPIQSNGNVVPLVALPPVCRDACTVEEFFTSISPYLNPLSLCFLRSIVSFTGCTSAIMAIAAFDTVRMANSHLMLCSDRWEVPTSPDGLNDLNTSARSDAGVAHNASLIQLKSIHPWVFARLPEHRAAELAEDCVQVSIRVHRKFISLADYDCILATICGFFMLPECAFTYVGCTERPLCLTWVVSNKLLEHLNRYGGGISGECMLAMQGVVNIMIGDSLKYKCLNSKEYELQLSSFYGLVDRLKVLSDDVDVNCNTYYGYTPLMVARDEVKVVQLLLDAGAIKDIQNKGGSTALIIASSNGRDQVVQLLIDAGANNDIQNVDGDTALTSASINGHEKVVSLLLTAKANINHKRKTGATALYCACAKGHTSVVQLLIQAKACLDSTTEEQWTALMVACSKGHKNVVEFLLQARANLEIRAKDGSTALIIASSVGHDQVVQLLIDAGANKDIQDVDGDTALTSASINGHEKVVSLLLTAKANINHKRKTGATALYCACEKGHTSVVQVLIQAKACLDSTTENQWTAIMAACSKGHKNVVELLLQARANLEIRNKFGRTALNIASANGHDQVVELLINAGANKDAQTERGHTSLIEACLVGHEKVVEKLLVAGANKNLTNTTGANAIHVACEQGHEEILQLFIKTGCNHLIDAQMKDGWTALHHACSEGHAQISELLIQSGASLDIKNFKGHTALMMASEMDHPKCVEQLVQAGADLNLNDQEQRTALYWAASKGHIKIVKYLMQAGADANIKDKNSNTPFDIASLNGHEEVCDYF